MLLLLLLLLLQLLLLLLLLLPAHAPIHLVIVRYIRLTFGQDLAALPVGRPSPVRL